MAVLLGPFLRKCTQLELFCCWSAGISSCTCKWGAETVNNQIALVDPCVPHVSLGTRCFRTVNRMIPSGLVTVFPGPLPSHIPTHGHQQLPGHQALCVEGGEG